MQKSQWLEQPEALFIIREEKIYCQLHFSRDPPNPQTRMKSALFWKTCKKTLDFLSQASGMNAKSVFTKLVYK